jgi:1-acyl-sn-glycerol-3-phosphate acyltransferase
MNVIIAAICLLVFAIATVVFSSIIIIGGVIAWIMPVKSWHQRVIKFLLKMPVLWTATTNGMMSITANHQWDIQGEGDLSPEKWYVLISNHQTWLDILILGYVFNRKIPILKFFMKKQLLWSLPFAGVACWILDYPFMQRHSHKEIQKQPSLKHQDIETTKKASHKFKLHPTTVMNFLEGTRFTSVKQKRQHSPFLHLLKPKAGGAATVINELRDCLRGIVNVTIHYSNPKITLLKFFLGMPCKITIRYELLPITADIVGDYYEDREFRVYFQRWLNLVWERKDLLLDELNRDKT